MLWTAKRDAELRRWWMTGLSTTAIGGVMALTKNAVVGRAHRLDLPGRPSPIKPRGEGAAAPVAVVRPAMDGVARGGKRGVLGVGTLEALGVAKAPVAAPTVVAVAFARAAQPCCWPIGEPGTQGFRYCEAAGVPGRSYCAAHCAVAYVPMAPRSPAQLAADDARRMTRGGCRPWRGAASGPSRPGVAVMVAGARDASLATATMDVFKVLVELPPLDQGVVLVGLLAELARLQPEPAVALALMFEVARVRVADGQ